MSRHRFPMGARAMTGTVLATVLLVGCTGSGGEDEPGPTAAPTTSMVPPSAEPTDVATDPPPSPSGTPEPNEEREVAVTLTFAGVLDRGSAVEAAGFVDVREDGGTCTLTLTRDGTTRTSELPATPDASTTACGGLAVPLSDLASGTWEAVLSYESADSAGRAPAVDVDVP
ncbi:hypothetical protein [Blastococcus xanthinilyticus]|uniref:Uncharacterized protein n=1 Tax=Blastococcus xanthinilyticus TaxID=1564164 RepID=A0A5S5D1H0_9ACTN|nr:hypothetical protein [Blastococcus xanthinilyticus]TYP89870.1 hypothetical protein BD833_102347 [Blastococcus xanthinilyticus]